MKSKIAKIDDFLFSKPLVLNSAEQNVCVSYASQIFCSQFKILENP